MAQRPIEEMSDYARYAPAPLRRRPARRLVRSSREFPPREPCARCDEAAGRDIPGLDAALVISVVAAAGAPAEIEGRRTEPPDVAHVRQQPNQEVGLAGANVGVEAKPCRDQGLIQSLGPPGRADRL